MSDSQRSSSALWQLTLARFREFWREPAAIFWVYGFPLIMMVALGVAFRNRPAEEFSVAVQSGSGSESIVSTLESDDRFDVEVGDGDECRSWLRTGEVDLVVVGETDDETGYRYEFDPTKPGSVIVRNAADNVLQRAAGREDAVATHDEEVTEAGSRYIDFLVPGLIGMGLMGGGLWGVGFSIVDSRIRKLLKRFMATPMKRSHFLGAIMISRMVFTIPEVLFLLVMGVVLFGVPNYGSYLAVTFLIVLGATTFSGIGLLIASRVQTIETASGLLNLVMLPMWIGSGVFFSSERFPAAVQPLIAIMPLTPLNNALRAVMLEGASLMSLGSEIAILAAWGAVSFVLALRFFRWN